MPPFDGDSQRCDAFSLMLCICIGCDTLISAHGYRFVRASSQSKEGRRGQFVKVNNWPAYTITRCPEDWGWVMENEWVIYRSISSISTAKEWANAHV